MSIKLSNFNQKLRPYQEEAVQAALSVPQGQKRLLAAPTGTGKGTIQLGLINALLKQGKDAWIVTPSLEVMRGYLERCGATKRQLMVGPGKLAELGEMINVTTPVRLRNRLRDKKRKTPTVIIKDEAHHATKNTVAGGELELLCPETTFIGFTATPYRGTPEETQILREYWGKPEIILDIPSAVKNKSWALPSWKVEGIIEDDDCRLKAGDLDAGEIVLEKIDPLAKLVAKLDLSVPTAVTVPSIEAVNALVESLAELGVQAWMVIGETPSDHRAIIYDRMSQGLGEVMVSIKVLGEGVDMPWLRRWVDASPTLSPVAFLQKLGRITRPGERQPEYVGTNRNLERHAYLLDGLLPRAIVKEAQDKFGGPSTRGARCGLIKGISRRKPIELPLAGGVKGTMWVLSPPRKQSGWERALMLDPTDSKVICAKRYINVENEGKERWGKWETVPVEEVKSIKGLTTKRSGKDCSDAQWRWWQREAYNRGLNKVERPSKSQFFALPVLVEINDSFRAGWSVEEQAKLDKEKEEKKDKLNRIVECIGCGTETRVANAIFLLWKVEPNVVCLPCQTKPAKKANVNKILKEKQQEKITTDAIPDGYYTVVENGAYQTYRVRTQPDDVTFFPGYQLLSYLHGPDNGKDYRRCGMVLGEKVKTWRKYNEEKERFQRHWEIIKGDYTEAGKTYAVRSGNCYICSRLLTTPASVKASVGPICADRWGIPHGDNLKSAGQKNGTGKGNTIKRHKESNQALMNRLVDEGKCQSDIEAAFFERYKDQGKSDDWIYGRVDTYQRISKRRTNETA